MKKIDIDKVSMVAVQFSTQIISEQSEHPEWGFMGGIL